MFLSTVTLSNEEKTDSLKNNDMAYLQENIISEENLDILKLFAFNENKTFLSQ